MLDQFCQNYTLSDPTHFFSSRLRPDIKKSLQEDFCFWKKNNFQKKITHFQPNPRQS